MLSDDIGTYIAPNSDLVKVDYPEVIFKHQNRPLGSRPIIILDKNFGKDVILHEFLHHLFYLKKRAFFGGEKFNSQEKKLKLQMRNLYKLLQNMPEDSEQYILNRFEYEYFLVNYNTSTDLEELLINRILIENYRLLKLEEIELKRLMFVHKANLVQYSNDIKTGIEENVQYFKQVHRDDLAEQLLHQFEIAYVLVHSEFETYISLLNSDETLR